MINSVSKQRTNQEIEKVILYWKQALNLTHWRIRLSEKKPSKGNALEIVINRDRQLASIRISDKAREASEHEFDAYIAHELLHLTLDYIAEELEFQMQDMPETKAKEAHKRYLRAVEKSIEHLAYALSALYD